MFASQCFYSSLKRMARPSGPLPCPSRPAWLSSRLVLIGSSEVMLLNCLRPYGRTRRTRSEHAEPDLNALTPMHGGPCDTEGSGGKLAFWQPSAQDSKPAFDIFRPDSWSMKPNRLALRKLVECILPLSISIFRASRSHGVCCPDLSRQCMVEKPIIQSGTVPPTLHMVESEGEPGLLTVPLCSCTSSTSQKYLQSRLNGQNNGLVGTCQGGHRGRATQ